MDGGHDGFTFLICLLVSNERLIQNCQALSCQGTVCASDNCKYSMQFTFVQTSYSVDCFAFPKMVGKRRLSTGEYTNIIAHYLHNWQIETSSYM
jgi:hypothetical protein